MGIVAKSLGTHGAKVEWGRDETSRGGAGEGIHWEKIREVGGCQVVGGEECLKVNMELHRESVWIGVMCSVDLVQQSSGPVEVCW